MAAIYDGKMEIWEGFKGEDLKGDCYYCGKAINAPLIWWRGDPDLFFHPECVIQFIIRLMCDVHEIQSKTNTRFEMSLAFDKSP
jgi:hypothetical protein